MMANLDKVMEKLKKASNSNFPELEDKLKKKNVIENEIPDMDEEIPQILPKKVNTSKADEERTQPIPKRQDIKEDKDDLINQQIMLLNNDGLYRLEMLNQMTELNKNLEELKQFFKNLLE